MKPEIYPCRRNPELWFTDARRDVDQARLSCLLECPLAQHRVCAREALDSGAADGIWASVRLPGQRKYNPGVRARLAAARQVLADIADGKINPRQLEASQVLLVRASEHQRSAAS